MFYDRVPLMIPTFEELPNRTVSLLDTNGNGSSSVSYLNRLTGGLHNPQSASWSVALERQVLESLTLRVGYEQRNTSKVFVVSPTSNRELRHSFSLEFRARFLPGIPGSRTLQSFRASP